MAELVIGDGTQVSLHFALRLANGELVDSNFNAAPATFMPGDGNLLPGFERVLLGLAAGYSGTFRLSPEQAFGPRNPNNVQQFPRRQFTADLTLKIGAVLSFADAQNAELPGVIVGVTDEQVTVDFNHPLAGQTIEFDVEIISVLPARTH